jgi:hypothetical protein
MNSTTSPGATMGFDDLKSTFGFRVEALTLQYNGENRVQLIDDIAVNRMGHRSWPCS